MIKNRFILPLLLGGLALLPVASARSPRNLSAESLYKLRSDATQVKTQAATLASVSEDPNIDWRLDAGLFLNIKDEINDMGKALNRLEGSGQLSASQDSLNRTAQLVATMADSTSNAINHLNQDHLNTWQPFYRNFAQDLYNQAGQLNGALKNLAEQAHVRS
jgi:methyl-accepting chemotaxis protein